MLSRPARQMHVSMLLTELMQALPDPATVEAGLYMPHFGLAGCLALVVVGTRKSKDGSEGHDR